MKTATRPEELTDLGNCLQEDLQSYLHESIPVQVRCRRSDERLAIWVQHPAEATLDQDQILAFLEQTIRSQYPLVAQQARVNLLRAGEKKPYVSRSLFLNLPEPEPETTTPSDADSVETNATEETNPPSETETPQNSDSDETQAESSHPWDQPIPEVNDEADASESEKPPSVKVRLKSSLLPLVVAGAGLSLLVFFSTLYVLTRPCVMGECAVLPEAEQLSQKSTKTLQNPESGKAVLEAQEQLQEAIQLVAAIPPWSRYHSQAQQKLQIYQSHSETVADMVEALKTAARAGYESQNPPHPESKWREVQNLWRDAIAKLEQLPTDSNLQPLAKAKIKAYKTNLEEINQRLLKERKAQEHIKAAQEAARMAQARQGIAQSLSDWQLVYATWQASMQRLKQIPQGTTPYEEAQELLALYLPKLANARDRKTSEQIAANAYNQGVRLAQLATDSQTDKQWSAALIHWRNALTYVNQVPKDTYYYTKSQSLVEPYRGALKQAQNQLQLAVKMQQARRDLSQTCFGKPSICSYTIDNKMIKVQLTPAYVQMVQQRALSARSQGDSQAHAGIVNHILTLGEALEVISDNAKLRVEVYTPEGVMIQAHNPAQ
ncbi:MAG: hypothetical protein RID09_11940 [Coleofasciculus sp. G1-WW12-02]|uniref:hypothetical protein n=1 Tax=unclassified Coleofasciculus TaxID=2692782 RepID=UPI0032FB759A